MKLRTIELRTPALLLSLSLVVVACGDAASNARPSGPAGSDDQAADHEQAVTSTWPAASRGWLEGEDLEWTSDAADPAESDAGGHEADYGADDAAPGSTVPGWSETDRSSADGIELSAELSPVEPRNPVPGSPLRAGSIDDAADVAAFLDYRERITESGVVVRPLDLRDSTVFNVMGNNGLPVLDAVVELWDPEADRASDSPVVTLRTTADGSVRFSPAAMAASASDLDAAVRIGDVVRDVEFTVGDAAVTIDVDVAGGVDGAVPLDVHLVLDATGSMGDEIAGLRENMTRIAQQIDALPSAPDVRFGMTVYRDEGDVFVTRTFDLTDDLGSFLDALSDVQAEGGGDYPEALDEALADALEKPEWRRDGAVELMFLVADAPPQVSRPVEKPYTDTAIAAAEAGVKIFPVAASGTDDQAEYAMRDLAFVTGGRFVFLSYGGGDAATGEQTDISAADYDELPLDQLVVRIVEDELAALTGELGQDRPTTTTTVPVTTTTYAQ